MAWVRLEDTFPEHPKIDAAGGDAAWLHVCALAYCNRNETDGFIASDRIGRLSDRRRPIILAGRLVSAGLWELRPDGWMIHDYLDYQPSKATRDKERGAARERMRRARTHTERSEDVRANNDRSSPNPDPTRPDPFSTGKENSTVPTPAEGVDISRHLAIAAAYARTALSRANDVRNEAGYLRKTRETALDNPDLARLSAKFPTAPPDVIAAALHGETHSLGYFPAVDDPPARHLSAVESEPA